MYKDYLDDIVKHYREGEMNGDLPLRLIQPTPAGIKEECISVCEARFRKEDLRTLNTFFKGESDQHSMLKAINRFDRNRFKPLVKFLKKETKSTDDLNIELLGWLIDFPGRPYKRENYLNTQNTSDQSIPEKEEVEALVFDVNENAIEQVNLTETNATELAIVQKTKSPALRFFSIKNKRMKIVAAAILLSIFISIGFYELNKTTGNGTVDNTSLKLDDANADVYPAVTNVLYKGRSEPIDYARCTGLSPCRACSNCSSCNWCNSGGTCSVCKKDPPERTQKRALQCQATTKKGKQCSRAAEKDKKFCWQHRQ